MDGFVCECFPCGPIATNLYILLNRKTRESVIIEAPIGAVEVYEQFSKHYKNDLRAVLLTHSHWDHMASAAIFKERFCVPVHIGHGDDEWLRNPPISSADVLPCEPDAILADMQMLNFLDVGWNVRVVSGHTPGGVIYAIPSENIVFTGDSLFRRSIGRSDLPGGDGEKLIEHLKKRVLVLPRTMVVYPGHGNSSTIGEELEQNPYFGCATV
jgi:glyoxylase-like metal-dependent hydrolase (beta-lactamase superfamily II)